jgi:hypothetical protein
MRLRIPENKRGLPVFHALGQLILFLLLFFLLFLLQKTQYRKLDFTVKATIP